MISTLKTQLLMLALVAGIAAPVSAMDSNTDSSGWFGWKTAAGLTVVVCAGGVLAYKWLTAKKAATLSVEDFTDLGAPQSKEDLKAEIKTVQQEIEKLERQIAQEEATQKPAASVTKAKKPAGQKGRALPTRTKPAVTEQPQEVVAEAPVEQPTEKKVKGVGYGVTLGTLNKVQLKKTNK